MSLFRAVKKSYFGSEFHKLTNNILEHLLKIVYNTFVLCGQQTVGSNQWRNYWRDCTGAQTPLRAHLGFTLAPTTLFRASLSQQVSKGVLPQEWGSETLRLAMAYIPPAALYISSINTYCRNCVCVCMCILCVWLCLGWWSKNIFCTEAHHDHVTLMTLMTSFIIIWFVY